MNKYRVEIVRAVEHVVVDAEDERHAREIVSARRNVSGFIGRAQLFDPSARTETYTCSRCGKPSLKELWGPGRVRCPECNQIERSAEEFQALPPAPPPEAA